MNRKSRKKSGETLVETIVSIFVFLLLMAGVQGAVSFCTNAQRRSVQIRERNAEICRGIRMAAYESAGETAEFEFRASSASGSQTGSTVLFRVEADLGKKEAVYADEAGTQKTSTFYLFGSKETGGGSP